ncbi:MAG: 50S ribosomal protein L5 [Candidatus Anoxychlamydiales bacterium]|nr:50S ribosomal protein L5 [Candidatus Anoxychlamydiales bacterium]
MSRLKEKYNNEVLPAFKKKYSNRNIFEIPKLKKIIISMGLNEAVKDKTSIQDHLNELTLLSGQKPVQTKTKKAISNFKLREDQVVGLKVTLRKKRMYDFLDRFCNIVSPRIRDFRGFKTKADGRGSYSLGLSDQAAFPEINLDKVKRNQGMNITFVTTAKNNEDCIELLKMMGFPFK